MADDEEDVCPLCIEEMDITDKNFMPCPCGYRVCMWCWHHIKENLNGLCPACRRQYGDDPHAFSAVDREEVVKSKRERQRKEKLRKRQADKIAVPPPPLRGMVSPLPPPRAAPAPSPGPPTRATPLDRSSLQNVRVVQRDLVYVIGLPLGIAKEETLKSPSYFGQYGRIAKVVVNRNHNLNGLASAAAYITFCHREDARAAINAVDNFYLDGKYNIRASFGTTKYCNQFLNGRSCANRDCLYLHELGNADDRFSKDEIQAGVVNRPPVDRDASGFSTIVGLGGPTGTGRAVQQPVLPAPRFALTPELQVKRKRGARAQAGAANLAAAGQSSPPSKSGTQQLQQQLRQLALQQNRIVSEAQQAKTALSPDTMQRIRQLQLQQQRLTQRLAQLQHSQMSGGPGAGDASPGLGGLGSLGTGGAPGSGGSRGTIGSLAGPLSGNGVASRGDAVGSAGAKATQKRGRSAKAGSTAAANTHMDDDFPSLGAALEQAEEGKGERIPKRRSEGLNAFALPPPAMDEPRQHPADPKSVSPPPGLGNPLDAKFSDADPPEANRLDAHRLDANPLDAAPSTLDVSLLLGGPMEELKDAWTKTSSEAASSSTNSSTFLEPKVEGTIGGGLFGNSIWGANASAGAEPPGLSGWGEARGSGSSGANGSGMADLSFGSLGLDTGGPRAPPVTAAGLEAMFGDDGGATDMLAKVLGVQLPRSEALERPPSAGMSEARDGLAGGGARTGTPPPGLLYDGEALGRDGRSSRGGAPDNDVKSGIALLQKMLPGVKLTYGSAERGDPGEGLMGDLRGSGDASLPPGLGWPDALGADSSRGRGSTGDSATGGLFGNSIWSGTGGDTWGAAGTTTAGDRGGGAPPPGFLQSRW